MMSYIDPAMMVQGSTAKDGAAKWVIRGGMLVGYYHREAEASGAVDMGVELPMYDMAACGCFCVVSAFSSNLHHLDCVNVD